MYKKKNIKNCVEGGFSVTKKNGRAEFSRNKNEIRSMMTARDAKMHSFRCKVLNARGYHILKNLDFLQNFCQQIFYTLQIHKIEVNT